MSSAGQYRFIPTSLAPELPVTAHSKHSDTEAHSEILDILKNLQSGIDNHYSEICCELDKVCDRLDVLE